MSTRRATVQAGEVTYELHTLGWKAFQNLCITISAEIWGQTVQSFFDSHDGGRDGAFHGTWKPKGGEALEGSFTAQCKFTSHTDKQIYLRDLKDELSKAKRLGQKGLAENYILFTNCRLTGANEEQISVAFRAIPGIKHFAAYGVERLSMMIQESPRLRMLVPRVYGLGDLSQIFEERAYNQASEILSSLGEDLAKFVVTDAYQRSAKAIVEHGFVLLLGEPACGKSTIAAALSLGALDEWHSFTLKVRDADEFVHRWNPHEPNQFFWVDDAFGATQYASGSANAWNKAFPHMQAAIRRGSKILFTSRDYIYQAARQHLKETALPVIKESQVVIQVEELKREEREQILYNHIRLGTQSKEFKTRLKPFLTEVAGHKRFSPEIARRLGNPLFTRRLSVTSDAIGDFVARPIDLLVEVIRTLDTASRAALALVFMRGGVLATPLEITPEEDVAIERVGATRPEVRAAIRALEGSLVIQSIDGGINARRFKHPTIRDAFASLVADDPELLDIYLAGTPLETLFREVSCGVEGIRGVKLNVPQTRYNALLHRLSGFQVNTDTARGLHWFLATRCDAEFLKRYIAAHPNFISSLRVFSFLYVVSDVDVLIRLRDFGLLPEDDRQKVVAQIRKLAVRTPDSGFLREDVGSLLAREEVEEIVEDVRNDLLPNLDDEIQEWRSNFDSSEEASVYFDPLLDSLRDYRRELDADPEAVRLLDEGIGQLHRTIQELEQEVPEERSSSLASARAASARTENSGRSIFEDVDE